MADRCRISRPIRHFVLAITGGLEAHERHLVQVRGQVFIRWGNLACLYPMKERRVRFNDQAVQAEMLRREIQCLFQRVIPGLG